jgi:hypothetical protein
MTETKSVAQKREEVISLLQEIDYKSENDSVVDFYSMTIETKSTRLGWLAVKYLYQILTDDDDRAAWEQTADQLRDRLRLNVLSVHSHGDSFDGRPFRSAELDLIINKLEQYQTEYQ